LIKDAGDESRKPIKWKPVSKRYLKAQKTMTKEFDALTKNYTNVMEAFSFQH
jgi:hypothetical protein